MKRLKMVDLNDTFLVATDASQQGTARGRYAGKGSKDILQDYHRLPIPAGVIAPHAFNSARNSIENQAEKYASLIRQYERNHELLDSRGRL